MVIPGIPFRLLKDVNIPAPFTVRASLGKVADTELAKIKRLVTFYIFTLMRNLAKQAKRNEKSLIKAIVSPTSQGDESLELGELFGKAMDPQNQGEIGFPTNFSIEGNLRRALKEALFMESGRISLRTFRFTFGLDYEKMRNLTPHPGTRTTTGRNIRVKSWLDWLHGDAVVTDAGFVSLDELGVGPSRGRSLSPRSVRRVGGQAGWMLRETDQQDTDAGGSRGGRAQGRKKRRRNVRIPPRWRISNPVNPDWLTENNIPIGFKLVRVFRTRLVPRAQSQTNRMLRGSALRE